MLSSCKILKQSTRNFSKYVHKDRTAKAIRQRFLDYFINKHNHNFIRSSPVVPFCDPTVAFVNAGMNQFKGVFMGTQKAQYKKVANSQKCVRVGGKHNDLRVVGTDGYHHTFFEMLGNWSFGDYFKREACQLAWDLLTKEYKIAPSRLYVTYFKGDFTLGLGEDLETKDIWRTIGIPEDRIVAFGVKENFWEMGSTGPCGPCTEIHIDHTTTINRSNLVNRGLHDLTELWNLVFIKYNRINSNTVDLLPNNHIDTGMGFERLTAVLQGKISNYDTDNFTYLLEAIHKNCSPITKYEGKFGENDWNNLDSSYRTLADHARMITVCLADGVIPEENQKLRRIIRKAFLLSESVFLKEKGLLKELSNYVIENLGPVYNELERNAVQIHQVIDYEEDVYKIVRKSAAEEWGKLGQTNPKLLSLDVIESPSLVSGYKELKTTNPKSITDQIAFKLYDTFGLDEECISELAEALDLPYDPEGLSKQLENARTKTKAQNFLTNNITYEQLAKDNVPKTDCSQLYNYYKIDGKYTFEKMNVKVLKIVENLKTIPKVDAEVYCSLLLDKTNLYTEAGGQISDEGTITFGKNMFKVTETQSCNGYVLHKGFLHGEPKCEVKVGDSGVLHLNPDFRIRNMRNHTAVHLLNSILKEVKGATCQKSSKVTDNYLNLDVGIFGKKLSPSEIQHIETTINRIIREALPVSVKELNSQELTGLNYVTLIPGEIYPESGIRLIEVKGSSGFLSREPCCGTHVFNTADIGDFCLVSVKSLGRSTASIHAVTGDRAKMAKANGVEILDNLQKFEKNVMDDIDQPEVLNLAIASFKKRLNYNVDDIFIIPHLIKLQCNDILTSINKQIKDSAKGTFKEFVVIEMQNALDYNISRTKKDQKYMVHYLRSSMVLDNVPLQKATKLCTDIPVLVISYSDNMVKARCCVPKDLTTRFFTAELWLKETVAEIFKSNAAPPKGQDGCVVCNMKAKRISIEDWDPLLRKSLEEARKYIEEHL